MKCVIVFKIPFSHVYCVVFYPDTRQCTRKRLFFIFPSPFIFYLLRIWRPFWWPFWRPFRTQEFRICEYYLRLFYMLFLSQPTSKLWERVYNVSRPLIGYIYLVNRGHFVAHFEFETCYRYAIPFSHVYCLVLILTHHNAGKTIIFHIQSPLMGYLFVFWRPFGGRLDIGQIQDFRPGYRKWHTSQVVSWVRISLNQLSYSLLNEVHTKLTSSSTTTK